MSERYLKVPKRRIRLMLRFAGIALLAIAGCAPAETPPTGGDSKSETNAPASNAVNTSDSSPAPTETTPAPAAPAPAPAPEAKKVMLPSDGSTVVDPLHQPK